MLKAQTLKGFRDFLPQEAKKRQYFINTLQSVFKLYGFEPLETPALEYEEILLGKYGEEGDKLMYRFEDLGKRKVALRYDQTVPLARVAAQYASVSSAQGQPLLPMPFKRYQIQPVWRAENTQKGRFREFLQCDIDTLGTSSLIADAEIIAACVNALQKLGFQNFKILVNDRRVFSTLIERELASEVEIPLIVRAIDKMKKIGTEGVIKELIDAGIAEQRSQEILDTMKSQQESDTVVKEIRNTLKTLSIDEKYIEFDPTLARGLDYYTGMIFEVEIEGYSAGSVAGGGRYDNLIGLFTNQPIPAVGCAFGFDRIMEALEKQNLFPSNLTESSTKILVTIFSPELKEQSIKISSQLRLNNITTEIYLNENAKLDKQLKYADNKNIPFVLIAGPEEIKNNQVKVKNMRERTEQSLTLDELLNKLKDSSENL